MWNRQERDYLETPGQVRALNFQKVRAGEPLAVYTGL